MSAVPPASVSQPLACPRCHAPLELPEPPAVPRCTCGAGYGWDGAFPDLTPIPPPPGLVAERWALWERVQANGAAEYEAAPASSLSVGDRVDVRLFAGFAALQGRVLDVGCGPQERPAYVPDGAPVELVGIDPLSGAASRRFTFVRGLAEYLPFPDGSFERVLFATSLDHLLDPARALREAARVLAPGGRVAIWAGVSVRAPLWQRLLALAGEQLPNTRRQRARERAAQPPTPDGAVDAYHLGHPDADQIERWLGAAGLRATERARLVEPTSSLFLAAER